MAAEPSDRKRAEFLSRAGQPFDRMFGADGQNGLVTFAQREERACEVADAAARWLMAEHIALDPSGPSSVEAACPLCGGPMRYESVNRRVKGTEKSWVRGGAECVLAARAAYLSEDGRAARRGRPIGAGDRVVCAGSGQGRDVNPWDLDGGQGVRRPRRRGRPGSPAGSAIGAARRAGPRNPALGPDLLKVAGKR